VIISGANSHQFSKNIFKNHHNCLQYERVLKILYFGILNDLQIWINILIYRSSPLEQHYKIIYNL
jgi:hypothetical protein